MRISLLMMVAVLAGVLTGPAHAAQGGTCQLDPDPAWSATEQWVWTQTCNGEKADISDSGLDDNRLSAKFLETILLSEPWSRKITHKGVIIVGARIKEPLDLSHATIPHPLALDRSALADIDLKFATVGGYLSFQGSSVTGTLDMDSLKTVANLYMRGGATFNDVIFIKADIGGTLELNGSTVSGTLDMEQLKVASNLYMHDGAFNTVLLRDADIGATLGLNGSTVTGALNMERLRVATDLFMREGTRLTSMDLTHANIGGSLVLATPGFTGPKWAGEASQLNLTNARITAIWDLPDAWPPHVTLFGFTYTDFGRGENDMSERPSTWLTGWLARSQPFSPQPYEQLAQVLRKRGHAAKAEEVLYAKEERYRTEFAQGWGKVFLWLKWATIGYGYHPFWALWWLGGIIALGAVVARASRHPDLPTTLENVEYAADMVVPIVKFRAKHATIEHGNDWVRLYFYVHQLMGYFLAYFIITALTTT